jgi:ribosomal protein S13
MQQTVNLYLKGALVQIQPTPTGYGHNFWMARHPTKVKKHEKRRKGGMKGTGRGARRIRKRKAKQSVEGIVRKGEEKGHSTLDGLLVEYPSPKRGSGVVGAIATVGGGGTLLGMGGLLGSAQLPTHPKGMEADFEASPRSESPWRGLKWGHGAGGEFGGEEKRQPVGKFRRGKPMDVKRVVGKAFERGVYGCGRKRAKRRARLGGVSERARRGLVGEEVRVDRENRLRQERKEERVIGAERQRKENEGRQIERKMGTVRGKRIARGLPVRGQRTSTNGKTARKRNRKRG